MRFLALLLLSGLLTLSAAAQTESSETESSETEDPSTPIATPAPARSPVQMNNGRAEAGPRETTLRDDDPSARSLTISGRPIGATPDGSPSSNPEPVISSRFNNGRDVAPAAASTTKTTSSKALSPSTVRITNAGPDGDAQYDAFHPDLAYNPTAGEYFVVWAGNDDSGSLIAREAEIFGVRVNETTGQPLSPPIRISTMGGDGDAAFAALHPSVAYNPVEDDYLVVWQGSATAGEFEIFGRRFNASDLSPGAQIQLTDIGTAGDPSVDMQHPSIAADPVDGTYFLAWHGNAGGEVEVYGQTLTSTGDTGGSSVLQLSEAGPSGNASWRASHPSTAFNPVTNAFWIVWSGSDDQGGLVAGEQEIFLRRVDDAGAVIGTDGERISAMGADGDASIDAERPQLLADAQVGEMFVTWSSNTVDGAGAYEVYGQRLDLATASEQGTDDLRLSTMGADGQTAFSGFAPAVAGIGGREYTVLWRGDDAIDNAFDVYAQRVYADLALGDEDGDDDLQVSTLSDGGSTYGAVTAAVAAGPSDTYLAIWSGDTSGSGMLVEGEHEIFGQILSLGTPLPVEFSTVTVQPTGNDIQVAWQTLSETNNDRFDVQRRVLRSGEAKQATSGHSWQTIGTVPGGGTTADPTNYQFVDRALPYEADALGYRLQQVDVDGTATLSAEVWLDRSAVTRLELLATFPNPARGFATVQFAVPRSFDASDEVRLILYDMLGRRIRTVQQGIHTGRNEIRLNVANVAPGVYFLRLVAGSQIRTQKLTVVR